MLLKKHAVSYNKQMSIIYINFFSRPTFLKAKKYRKYDSSTSLRNELKYGNK